ncbi:MAG: cytochrome c oxidase subunit IV, partial [bacterium]
ALNNFVMLGIAVTKATLVVLFFMHARHSSQLTKMTIVASVVWLVILFTFILQDYLTRGMLPYPGK